MRASSRWLVLLTVVSTTLLSLVPQAGPALSATEKRIALIIGNAAYQAGALATPANDAGLVAQTLQAAGFDVVGARDLDEDALRRAMLDFTDKAAASGPDTVAFVYLAGYGLQLNGENYFAPIDAQIAKAADAPVRALRLSDHKRQLAARRSHGSGPPSPTHQTPTGRICAGIRVVRTPGTRGGAFASWPWRWSRRRILRC